MPLFPLWKRLYLLCARPDGLISEYDELGALVRAGILAELYLTRAVVDREGRAYIESGPPHPGALEQQLIAQISASEPRTWEHWISKDPRPTACLARDQLVYEGALAREQRRALGFVPYARCRATDLQWTAQLRASVEAILRAARGGELDGDAIARAARDALSYLPDNVKSLSRRQRQELMAELRERAQASLRATHPGGEGRAINDADAAFVALAMRIPYRCKHFKLTDDYYDQIRVLTERIGPIAPALSSVFSNMKWKRAASTT